MSGLQDQRYWDVEATVAYINEHYTWGQPGWKMTALLEYGMPPQLAGRLVLEAKVRNTYDPDNPALSLVAHTFPIPPVPMSPAYVDGWVRSCIHRAVTHEADEWFRKDGVMIFDPHRDDPPR